MSQLSLPAARSFTVRNPRHQITGLSLGGDNPTVLDVIIGVTPGETTLEAEHEKARAAAALGVLMVTDVTSDGDGALRRRILGDDLDLVFRTVPTYEIYRLLRRGKGTPRDAVLSTLEAQGEEGVDFITIHGSTSLAQIRALSSSTRAIPMTSRGGAMMAEIMQERGVENPYATCFDEVLDICAAYGMALSFATTFRTGSVADAMSRPHLDEISHQIGLVRRAHERGVNVCVELLGHVPLNLIPAYCDLGRAEFDGAPFGALGPLPTDIAIRYDDVAGAMGAAVAVMHGTPWVACLTAGEHIHLPKLADTIQAIKYFQLAVHIGELARSGDLSRDKMLSDARSRNDWPGMVKLAIHRDDAQEIVDTYGYHDGEACTMCRGACPLVRTQTLQLSPDIPNSDNPYDR